MSNTKSLLFRNLVILLTLLLVLAVFVASVFAADGPYPNKPLQMIIPTAAGGSTDIVGRLIATKLTKRLGQQVVVVNNGAGGGIVAAEMVAKSNPDGYTLFITAGSFATEASLQKLPYDPIKDFTPIARLAVGPFALVVNPNVPANSVKDLIGLAKQKPGKLIFVTAGRGGPAHLGSELFKIMADVDFTIVHFRGNGPAIIDLVGGHSNASLVSLPVALPHIKSGKLRVLGTGGEKRSILLPDVPTISEAGVPGYALVQWFGVFAPAGTPAPIADRLGRELKVIIDADDIKNWFINEGVAADYQGSNEFGPFYAGEVSKWVRIVKEAGIEVEK